MGRKAKIQLLWANRKDTVASPYFRSMRVSTMDEGHTLFTGLRFTGRKTRKLRKKAMARSDVIITLSYTALDGGVDFERKKSYLFGLYC